MSGDIVSPAMNTEMILLQTPIGMLRVREVDFEPAHEPWGEYIANVGDDGTRLKARYTVTRLFVLCDEDGTTQRDAEGNIRFYHQGEVQCVTRS